MSEPVVGILVGSESDRQRMQAAMDELDARGIGWEFDVRSAHRMPDAVAVVPRSVRRAPFAATPTTFVGDSMTAATTVLLAAALGLLVSSALSALPAPVPAGQPEPEPEDVPLDALLLPAPRAAADASADQELSR